MISYFSFQINLFNTLYKSFLSLDIDELVDLYNDFFANISSSFFHDIKCSECIKHNRPCLGFRKHGFYRRSFFVFGKERFIFIQRIICISDNCNKTHALIPPFLSPYKRFLLKNRIAIIKARINKDKIKLDNLLEKYHMGQKYIEQVMRSYYHCIKDYKDKYYINSFNEAEAEIYHKKKDKSFLQDSRYYINLCL